MSIGTETISFNPYAAAGSNAVSLYSTSTAKHLTLGQLLCAVCLKAGALQEAQSINKMNILGRATGAIDDLSEQMAAIARGNKSSWASGEKAKLEGEPYNLQNLPDTLDTYDRRMQALNAIKNRLDQLTQQSQQDMIDLQSYVNRRDVAYSTSANLIRALGQSKTNMASKMTR